LVKTSVLCTTPIKISMHFSILATALLSSVAVYAADILVKVGANNGLAFDPTDITAAAGDTISFQFQGKNHSVTQSTFASPCTQMTTPAMGVDSGFILVAANTTSLPQWSITVNNASNPLWFFCAQTSPVSHCQQGMVFSVNAPPAKTFAQFQAAAKVSTNSSSPTAGTGPGTGPGTSGSGTAVPGSSGNSTADASTAAKSGAGKLNHSTASALAVAAFFVAFVL
jgi:plastocyanin